MKSKWMVRHRTPPKGLRRVVAWHHNTESSSWWSDEVVRAESAADAAQRVAGWIDFDKHSSSRNGRRMTMRVYAVSEDYEEFEVGPTMSVEAKP